MAGSVLKIVGVKVTDMRPCDICAQESSVIFLIGSAPNYIFKCIDCHGARPLPRGVING